MSDTKSETWAPKVNDMVEWRRLVRMQDTTTYWTGPFKVVAVEGGGGGTAACLMEDDGTLHLAYQGHLRPLPSEETT